MKDKRQKAKKPSLAKNLQEFRESLRLVKKTPNGTSVNIKGIIYTCIELSMVSVFIDLVFFSGLSKSLYELFGIWYIAAAVPLSLMAIGFGLSKFFVAQRIGAVKELRVRLKDWTKEEQSKLKWYLVKWIAIHTFLIGLSVFTSASLSLNSIGSGITRNANTLKQIDTFIEQGTRYSELVNTANNTQLTAIVKKSTDTSVDGSIAYVESYMANIRPAVEAYKLDRQAFESQFSGGNIDWNSTWNGKVADDYWNEQNNKINGLLTSAGYPKLNGTQIKNLNLQTVEATLKKNYLATHQNTNSDEVKDAMEQVKSNTLEEAQGWLATLNSVGFTKTVKYTDDNGKIKWKTVPVEFDMDPNKSTKVLVDTAVTQLKAFRVDVENDSGDIGSSSKIFMIVGNAIDSHSNTEVVEVKDALTKKVSTGMGATEKFMMIFIAICGIIQEVLISMFTPEAQITRRLLGSCKSYIGEFDINRFLIYVYGKYEDLGLLSHEEALLKSKKCVRLILRGDVDNVIDTLMPVVQEEMEKELKSKGGSTPVKKTSTPTLKTPKAVTTPEPVVEKDPNFSSVVDDMVSDIENLIKK